MLRPFLRWPGGKRRLLREIQKRLPKHYKGYFEPFIGGGALFFAQRPGFGYIGDFNPEVANAYSVIKHKPAQLIHEVARHRNTETHYYALRNVDRDPEYRQWTDVQRAARFVFLNRTCFNGICRMNRRGQLNMGYGHLKKPTIMRPDDIWAAHHALRTIRVAHASFEEVLKLARPGDFVYFDPPYVPLSATASFTAYTAGGFGVEQQRDLWRVCVKLHRKGVKWMVSNSFTPIVVDLWRAFHVDTVMAPRSNGVGLNARRPVREVLITNYVT
ncbi:MAG: Dam family site-specific DNA-(adenine-N6)-methyltransferase [Magnetovibrio sp.]|nr:Dam family site-specific DNA-(adenine-N6)-methyltransferase [Magnetovibrio sp.]